jgi:hypothetical protein
LLSQVQPTLISLQDLIDGLGENAAGNRQSRNRNKCGGKTPTAAYAPFHERSLKVVVLLKVIGEGCDVFAEYMHK